jgi:hypothetical protein
MQGEIALQEEFAVRREKNPAARDLVFSGGAG